MDKSATEMDPLVEQPSTASRYVKTLLRVLYFCNFFIIYLFIFIFIYLFIFIYFFLFLFIYLFLFFLHFGTYHIQSHWWTQVNIMPPQINE